jgi:hypothetical protein
MRRSSSMVMIIAGSVCDLAGPMTSNGRPAAAATAFIMPANGTPLHHGEKDIMRTR